ncbi:MAG TPA: isoprenylcysteine carboxylmethyltransferase family protein [Pirellulales bacterium]|nr:isoprenylcysteine carboxylmethyltransferase family protein [Pirellulales bacterium]
MTDTTLHASPTTFRDFLVKQRVTISLIVFSSLILKDIVTGARPHDTGNLNDPLAMTGLATVMLGLVIRSWAAGVINKTKVLATTGPYRLCRHPLYLGSLLMMFGFCVLVGSLVDACVVFGPVLVIYLLTIQREERRLAERHGAAWAQYVAVAPQFFPYRPFVHFGCDWSLAQWLDNREYKAVLTATSALLLLHLWRAF